MKFACYESVVENIYKYTLPIPREDCPKDWQLGVSFVADYIAGISCVVVSHSADNLVSVLNNFNGTSVWDLSLFILILKFESLELSWIYVYIKIIGMSNLLE